MPVGRPKREIAYRSQEDTMNLIYKEMRRNGAISPETALTRLQISRLVNRKKSPHMIDTIEYMTQIQWLVKQTIRSKRNGRVEHRYHIRLQSS